MVNKKQGPLGIIFSVLSIFFLLLSTAFVFPSFKIVFNIYQSHAWPVTRGEIVSSVVELSDPALGENVPGQKYFARVWFKYQLDENEYFSDNLRFDQGYFVIRADAAEVAGQYTAGDLVKVRYCPDDLRVAVIENDQVRPLDAVKVGIGLFLFVTAISSFLSLFSRGRR